MNKVGLTRAERSFVVVFALLFAALGAFGMIRYVNRDNVWTPIVYPTQERAVEIVAISRLLQPYVLTEQGNLYFCSGGAWQDTCRQITKAELPINAIPGRWQTCQPVFPTLPALPGEPVSTLDVGQCQEGRTYARLVILGDGTIWRWQRNFSWVAGFGTASIAIASLFLGWLLGLAAVQARRYLRSPIPKVKPIAKDGQRLM